MWLSIHKLDWLDLLFRRKIHKSISFISVNSSVNTIIPCCLSDLLRSWNPNLILIWCFSIAIDCRSHSKPPRPSANSTPKPAHHFTPVAWKLSLCNGYLSDFLWVICIISLETMADTPPYLILRPRLIWSWSPKCTDLRVDGIFLRIDDGKIISILIVIWIRTYYMKVCYFFHFLVRRSITKSINHLFSNRLN